eukprot:143395_1
MSKKEAAKIVVMSDDPEKKKDEKPDVEMKDASASESVPKPKLRLSRAYTSKERTALAEKLRKEKKKKKEDEERARREKLEKQRAEIADACKARDDFALLRPLRLVLIRAVSVCGGVDLLKAAVEAVGDVPKIKEFRGDLGYNALHCASGNTAECGLDKVKYLIETLGFDMNEAGERDDKTPLTIAEESKNERVTEYLEARGAS